MFGMLASSMNYKFMLNQQNDIYIRIFNYTKLCVFTKIIFNISGGKRNGFFIESGAYDGEHLSNSLFFELKRNFSGKHHINSLRDEDEISAYNIRVYIGISYLCYLPIFI